MYNGPIDSTATSQKELSDSIAPNANYSRWMTDMAADIAHLKIHQLAIPGAHNSGVDKDGKFNIGSHWAICQLYSFSRQLTAGARYLDLRLVDASYKKDVGGSKIPRYKFIEIFEFAHGFVSVGRHLNHLVDAVRNFSDANPGEIVTIDFRKYDRGRNHAHNSLERCLPKFSSIKDRLIPPSAENLSIGEIRKNHPGCNIILRLNHNYPTPASGNIDKWPSGTVRREQIWYPIDHIWTPDTSEESITNLVTSAMLRPQEGYSVLSATVSKHSSPYDLDPDSPVRTEAFKPGFQNVNILMVDFINSESSRVSVVDKCIELNKLRAKDNIAPIFTSANLTVTAKDETIIDGSFQNTLVFSWNPASDNLGVKKYEIYQNGDLIATTADNPYMHRNFALRNYSFKIRAIDNTENKSEFSDEFVLILDTVPPTTPVNLTLEQGLNGTSVSLTWDHSIDLAGLEGYEVYLDDTFLKTVPYSPTNRGFTDIYGLIHTQQYDVKIRAKDNNGLYSEFSTITLYPRPTVINAKYFITGYDEATEKYDACILWETDAYSLYPDVYYQGETQNHWDFSRPEPGKLPTFSFQASQGERISHRCMTWYERYPVSDFIQHDFVFDATSPVKPWNLTVTSRTEAGTSISWARSSSANVINYAVSINEEAPLLIPSTENSYTFKELPLDKSFLIEVWAINDKNVPSTIDAITIESVDNISPTKPGTPVITNITQTSATISWTPSSDNIAVTGYTITINNKLAISTTSTQYTLTELEEANQYTVEIKAFDGAGNLSPSASVSFRTKARPTSPRELSYSNLTSASVKLSWLAGSDDGWVAGYQVFRDGTSLRMVDITTYDTYWLSPGRTYLFEVRTKDNEGYFSEPAHLQVTTPEASTPPGPVGNLRLNTTGTPTLLWHPPETGAAIQYIVTKDDRQWAATPASPTPQCLIAMPASGEAYLYEVRARSMADQFSEPVAIRIGFAPPHVLHLRDVTKTSFRLVWDAPLGAVGITGYQLTLDDAPPFFVAETQHVFSGLTRAGNYTVTVKTQIESGELSEPTSIDLYIQGNAPSAPQNFRYTQPTDETILEWDAPSEPVTGYQVTLVNPEGREFNYRPSATTMRERLPSRTRYEVRVVAINNEGPSRPLISEFTTK
ncbi:fibronectin type III domain-containing protein [Pseudomonas sp. IT-P4]|uniref:fibronectin type III domain-containing protein n=1 Tax=Pseudomonas sp. IT-P4 TaxID=3026446 RepID=UPI0039E05AA9